MKALEADRLNTWPVGGAGSAPPLLGGIATSSRRFPASS